MDEPRSLEEWAALASDDCDHMEGVCEICLIDVLRTYAEQETAAAELGGKVLQEWYENCQRERDALLAVARAKFEVSDNALYAGKEWGYLVDEEDILQLRAVLARPIVQRLMKEDVK